METLSFKIEEISHFANSVASAMEEQGVATRAISDTAISVSDETSHVTNVLAEVAQAADTTKGAAETVLGSSVAVQAAIEVLQVDVSEFFREIAV
jgi:methyl-accepting chemotaxis protein